MFCVDGLPNDGSVLGRRFEDNGWGDGSSSEDTPDYLDIERSNAKEPGFLFIDLYLRSSVFIIGHTCPKSGIYIRNHVRLLKKKRGKERGEEEIRKQSQQTPRIQIIQPSTLIPHPSSLML
ncbi:hypothetical protein EYC84_006844 [Monilinia fructicola]|uniref:Uncharacterized protein n=1 Tax=Monilinia fructicola TaxID=38448 RepID=A0A5M9K7E2_MONFR|nr:hypothetical protein EYC84_006844 [Monilinia fructicola]